MGCPRIETFDLNLLRIFDALFQHRSVNLAAREIGVSASAISHALGRLRRFFDDVLFVKGATGMTPTARAAEIADRVAAVLLQVRSVLEPFQSTPELTARHFRVRCSHFIGWLILPNVMHRLRKEGLGISFTVQCDDTGGIADDLDAGLIDLVVGTFGHVPERFESEVLFTDHWAWVARVGHPALESGLTTEQIFQLPQLVIANSSVRQSIDGVVVEGGLERFVIAHKNFLGDIKAKSRYGMQVNGVLVLNSALIAPAIIAQSDLIALLPVRLTAMMAERYNLTTIAFDGPDNIIEHRLVWHRKHGADPAIARLRRMFHVAIEEWNKTSHANRNPAV